jgi:hypothetical protein
MTVYDYAFGHDDLALLLLRRFYPERTDRESTIIRDYLLAHGAEFDKFAFSVRVGVGLTPDPTHLEGVQANTVFSTKKRIDMIAWVGNQAHIHEFKERVSPAVLGQLQTYRHLWLEENPDALDPRLVAIGRTSDEDTLRVLQANAIDVYIYPPGAN